jgi:hypothetical protein
VVLVAAPVPTGVIPALAVPPKLVPVGPTPTGLMPALAADPRGGAVALGAVQATTLPAGDTDTLGHSGNGARVPFSISLQRAAKGPSTTSAARDNLVPLLRPLLFTRTSSRQTVARARIFRRRTRNAWLPGSRCSVVLAS